MEREQLRDTLLQQANGRDKKKELVDRDLSKTILEYDDTSLIVVISGIRRCGKSMV